MAAEDIQTLADLVRVLGEEPRFAAFQIAARGDGYVEVRVGEGGVTLAEARIWRDTAAIEPHLVRSQAGSTMLLVVGSEAEFAGIEDVRDRVELAVVSLPMSRARLYVTLKNYLDLVALRRRAQERGRSADRAEQEIAELVAIARAISSERDIQKLLGLILKKSRQVTGADAGSVYIVEGQAKNPRERTLRFMVSQNDSIEMDLREFTLPVDESSIVGRTVVSRQMINIPDLLSVSYNKTIEMKSGYQSKSMLTCPLINQRDEVIGVIQLINKRKETAPEKLRTMFDFSVHVVPFDKRSEEMLATLASQAGISLENTLLYEDIRRLFEGFVNASVTAIEQRDPTTSGHSMRVATLTVGLAEMVDRETSGPFSAINFTADDLKEIEYAGLLHDFGKVGVREKVLVKAKKLYEPDREIVLARFDYIRKWLEAEALRRHGSVDADTQRKLQQIDEQLDFILKANEPTVMAQGGFERLDEIARLMYLDARGEERPYLTASEVAALKLPRGSLTKEERVEIESHVVHTFNFLETIPWGRRLGKIPQIAGSHHEKLDGTGYPRGLRGEEIRVETRMMTIADIFDALTASDRPYKKAVPVPKALDIIGFEVKEGKCDPDLFRIFVDSKVWHKVIPPA